MNDPVRTLARSSEYQSLYVRAKELNINLFDNITDLSVLQVRFLQYLETYHGIYVDIGSGDSLMDYERIKDDMLVDAYLVYRYKHRNDKDKGKLKNKFKSKGKGEIPQGARQLVFRKKRKS